MKTLTEQEVGMAWEQHKNFVYNLVHNATRIAPGIGFDEILSEAMYAFCRAAYRYDADKGEFLTYVGNCVRGYIMTFVRDTEKFYQLDEVQEKRKGTNVHPGWLAEFLDGMGEDAKFVAGIVLDTPVELFDFFSAKTPKQTPVQARPAIRRFLQAQGWTNSRVDRAFNELQIHLQNF